MFESVAYAMGTPQAGAGPASGTDMLMQFLPLIVMFVIFWFLLIRPQQKKMKTHQKMISELRRGDQIVTQGGIIAKVVKVKDDNELEVEIADGVKVRIVRATVAQVLSKTEPAAEA